MAVRQHNTTKSLLATARGLVSRLVDAGYGVVRLVADSKAPAETGWQRQSPTGKTGMALYDRMMADSRPVGLTPGPGHWVLDVDSAEREGMLREIPEIRDLLAEAPITETPGGGLHAYLREPPGIQLAQFQGNRAVFGPLVEKTGRGGKKHRTNDVDSRAHGQGQVVAPGSRTKAGRYRVRPGTEDRWPPPMVPAALAERINDETLSGTTTLAPSPEEQTAKTGSGSVPRHDILIAAVKECYRAGLSKKDARKGCFDVNLKLDDPLPSARFEDEFDRGWGWASRKWPRASSPEVMLKRAEQQARLRSGDFIFDSGGCAAHFRREVLEPSGRVILPWPGSEDVFAVFHPAEGTDEADFGKPECPGAWRGRSRLVLSDEIRAVLEKARNEVAPKTKVSAGLVAETLKTLCEHYWARFFADDVALRWDHGPGVLAFPDGRVLDFTSPAALDPSVPLSSAVRPARMSDLVMHHTEAAPSEIETPTYDRFMEEITLGDPELQADLERIPATALLRRKRQRILVMLGEGGNGKGTLLALWNDILGTYFHFVGEAWRGGGKAFWQADLEGRSLAVFDDSITERGFPWDTLKLITGGGIITAEHKHERQREFRADLQVVLTLNRLPNSRFKGASEKRRLVVHPFDFDVNEQKGREDENLSLKLGAEIPGILRRYLERAREIAISGSHDPVLDEMGERTRQATSEAWKRIAVVDRFVSQECIFDPKARIARTELWRAFKDWKAHAGETGTQQTLYQELAKMEGVLERRDRDGGDRLCFYGIRLRADHEEPYTQEAAPAAPQPTNGAAPGPTPPPEPGAHREPESPPPAPPEDWVSDSDPGF